MRKSRRPRSPSSVSPNTTCGLRRRRVVVLRPVSRDLELPVADPGADRAELAADVPARVGPAAQQHLDVVGRAEVVKSRSCPAGRAARRGPSRRPARSRGPRRRTARRAGRAPAPSGPARPRHAVAPRPSAGGAAPAARWIGRRRTRQASLVAPAVSPDRRGRRLPAGPVSSGGAWSPDAVGCPRGDRSNGVDRAQRPRRRGGHRRRRRPRSWPGDHREHRPRRERRPGRRPPPAPPRAIH